VNYLDEDANSVRSCRSTTSVAELRVRVYLSNLNVGYRLSYTLMPLSGRTRKYECVASIVLALLAEFGEMNEMPLRQKVITGQRGV
jgi:hypothetical protein